MEEFAQDIWLIAGGTVVSFGFDYPTRAAVIRLQDGGLVVWSPVTLTPRIRDQLDALGPVRYLIAPNTLHHLAVGEWMEAYPDAKLYGPQALAKKRPDLAFTGFLDGSEALPWGSALRHVVIRHKITTEVVFYHPTSSTVLFTDIIQQFPVGFHRGWRAIVARLDLMVGENPNVPRKFRLGFGSKAKARAMMQPVLDWPAERVVMAHGSPITANGQAVLKQAFNWLY